jgi:hypothetical protein
MRPELVSVIVLVLMFVIATTMPVNLGALALVAAFLVGTIAVGRAVDLLRAGDPPLGDGRAVRRSDRRAARHAVRPTVRGAAAADSGTTDEPVRARRERPAPRGPRTWSRRPTRGR